MSSLVFSFTMNTRSKRAQRSLLPIQSPPSEFSSSSTDPLLAGLRTNFGLEADEHGKLSLDKIYFVNNIIYEIS